THAYTLRGPSTKECPKTTPGTRYPHRSVLDTALPVLNSVARHLVYDGELLPENMHFAHITESDVNSATRKAGLGRRADIQMMILEPTGQISVIKIGQFVDPALFRDILGAERIKGIEGEAGD
ncbi:YetF domain-containing protein, partial [Corynebacterium striatum]|uniref:YetF domain-containing protein n=1 Tax=Corynebacterium striatum TaxID=43770 RepID=UPI003F7DA9C9